MRNMSFSLTTKQVLHSKKTVTRRNGWKDIKIGELIRAVEKCQGLKKGEHVRKLAVIKVTGKRREALNSMLFNKDGGRDEVIREGFSEMEPSEFVRMYCKHNKCEPTDFITRIEFEYFEVWT